MLAQTKDNDKLVGNYETLVTNLLMWIQKTTVELSDTTIAEKPPKYDSFVLYDSVYKCIYKYAYVYTYVIRTYIRDPRPKHLRPVVT